LYRFYQYILKVNGACYGANFKDILVYAACIFEEFIRNIIGNLTQIFGKE